MHFGDIDVAEFLVRRTFAAASRLVMGLRLVEGESQ